MSAVDPLNPMGGFDRSNPEPTPSLGMPPPPPPTAPGAPNVRPAAQPIAAAPKAPVPQTPAPDNIEAQLHQLLEQKKNIDQQLQQTLAAQKSTEQGKAAQFDTALKAQPQMPAQDQFTQQQPMPDHEAFAKQAPLLTILAALGGKLTKMSGLTMLKATNAMIQGTMSGNQEAYTQAKKVYDDEYAKFAERQKQKLAIYKDQLEAWKDTYQGREKSWQIASSAVGDTLTQLKDVQTSETSILRAQAQIQIERKKEAAKSQSDASGGGLSPEGVEMAAWTYYNKGTLPGGMGNKSAAQKAQIINRAAQIALDQGDDAKASAFHQDAYKASNTAMVDITKKKNAVEAFERTALKNLDLAVKQSDKTDRTGVPAMNRWLNAGKKSIAGDVDVVRLNTAIETAMTEYAKVIGGGTGAAQPPVWAMQKAHEMLSAANTPEQVRGIVDIMKSEMANRMSGFTEQIGAVRSNMGQSSGGASSPVGEPTTSNW